MKNGHTNEYWKGVEEGKKHIDPSPETIKRIETLEKKMDDILDQIKVLQKILSEFTSAIRFVKGGSKIIYRILLISATIVVSVVAIKGGLKNILDWFIK